MTVDVRLLAILDPAVLAGRDPVDAAVAAAAGGATALQLRVKDAPAATFLRWAERVVAAVDVPVYVNDRADVAFLAGAAGVHVGADDLPSERVRAVAPPGFLIGVSVGTAEEAERALTGDADYWSVGSVFATAHKADAGAAIGPDGFRTLAVRAPRGVPVIGIGGITAANADRVIAAGAAGVAAIGAVFGASDVTDAARRLRAVVDAALAAGS